MLHYYAKNFFAPTALYIAAESDNLTVYLIRDTERSWDTGTLTLTCQPWSSLYAEAAHHLNITKLVCICLVSCDVMKHIFVHIYNLTPAAFCCSLFSDHESETEAG